MTVFLVQSKIGTIEKGNSRARSLEQKNFYKTGSRLRADRSQGYMTILGNSNRFLSSHTRPTQIIVCNRVNK